MANGNGSTIKEKLSASPLLLVTIVVSVISATWALQESRSESQLKQSQCLARVSENVAENTRRIESIESTLGDFKEVPAQISKMSTDISYLREYFQVYLRKDSYSQNGNKEMRQ